jgi:ABC-2 type transport system ATP-binding protein
MSENAIEIRNVVKKFKSFQLGPLDITVPKGAIYGLVGPNGAGKTTTLDLIMGMGVEECGSITVFGLHHRKEEVKVKQRIGFVSPDISYAPWRKVKRLVHFIRPFYPTWDDEYCLHLLNKLHIGWEENILTMSFGNKIKLAVIIALSHHPELLLLDEPTIGIDAVSKQEIFGELLAAVQDENHTVLISSHGLSDIERFADHIGIIKNGSLLLEGRMDEIVERFACIAFDYENAAPLPRVDGVYVQQHSGNRWKAIIDTHNGTVEKLRSYGVKELSESPVTLEELFVALAKDQ